MSGALIQPIGADEFARAMAAFAPFSGKVALAVSGGPDSMALAACVKRWAQCDCIAFIVEHGLRAESAAEARQVKERLQLLGIPTEILPWEHVLVPARLHERARTARYGLLAEACHRHGAKDLLTAHHSGDQAETILMRLAKGSGIDGLAGIAAQTSRDGIRVLRPFLSVAKERLIATCEAAQIATVTDPSNSSEKYARGRLRKILPLLAAEGMTVESLLSLGDRAREAKDALDQITREFLQQAAQVEVGGNVRIDRTALRKLPVAIALRALVFCLRYVHEGEHPPEHASMSALLAAIAGDGAEARTLHGCIASLAQNHVLILREPSAANEVLPLSPGATVLWDGRWQVTADAAAPAALIRTLGNPPHTIVDSLAPDLRRKVPQGRVRAGLPSIWDGERLCAIPSFDEKKAYRLAYRKQTFP